MRRKSGIFVWVASISVITLMVLALGVTSVAAQSPKTVKVGMIAPMTGPAASVGEYMQQCQEFIFDRVNKAGGIKSMGGAQLVSVIGDSRGQPEVGMAEAERLIQREKVAVLTGAYHSGVSLTATTVAEKYGHQEFAIWRMPMMFNLGGIAGKFARFFE